MQVVRTIAEFLRLKRHLCRQDASEKLRRPSVGFVPTMGNLHDGHMALIRRMQKDDDIGVASIFVNPAQFGPAEDLTKYPRTLEDDLRKCDEAGVHLVFVPDESEMYHPDRSTEVAVGEITERYCGASRPGHFEGVSLVVAKLFNIVQPDRAYFGLKDYQQYRVIERMARDLDFPLEVVPCPTVREWNGLAMSSRNNYLSPEEKTVASTIYAGLCAAAIAFNGGVSDAAELVRKAQAELDDAVKLEYLEVAHPETLEPRAVAERGDVMLVAAKVGATRLIDNIILGSETNNAD